MDSSITSLGPNLGFEITHDSDVDPLLPIDSQESHLETDALLVSAPPESLAEVQAREMPGPLVSDTPAVSIGSVEPREPVLGMEFDSSEEARAFYSAYAERVGFRVRNSKSFTSRVDDTVIMRRFVCSRQGRPTKKDPFDLTKKRRNRASSREGCKAMLQVNRRENMKWNVSRCILEHCHALGVTPNPSSVLQKKLAKKPWELIVHNSNSETQQSGLGAGGGVAQSLLEYFKKMQAENPAFFYAVQVDNNNCVANVFWADARARMAYGYFGDVVIFDMTCKKNKRAVPFATFSGLNHHRQVIVFGCAFVTDESEASFTWLFETWLALMSGRRPVSFVTAHNEAMAAACSKVFPKVCHRFCTRDIFHSCKERLASVYSAHPAFKSELKRCVNESESIEEFESCWKLLLERYSLEMNMWLHSLFAIREKWVPLYLKGSFFGELSAAPKLETMHKFFQRHSITTTTLRDLVSQFDKAMAGQYEREVQADIASIQTRPILKTPSPLEKQASDIYTKAVFDLFQGELVESSGFLMEKIEDGLLSKFRVARCVDSTRVYIVSYNSSEKKVSCSCCMFEFSGILCRHMIRVSSAVGVLNLPEYYILKRWTKNAKSSMLSYEHSSVVQNNCKKALAWRCNDLCRDAIRFAEEGASSAVIYKIAKGALQKAFSEVLVAKRGTFFK